MQPTAIKKPRRTKEERAAEAAAKAQRAQEREAQRLQKLAGLAECRELARKLPAGHENWGAVRTGAWKACAVRCARLARSSRGSPAKIQAAVIAIKHVPTAALESLVRHE